MRRLFITGGSGEKQPMFEIIAAILHNGIGIEEFEEYPFDLDGGS